MSVFLFSARSVRIIVRDVVLFLIAFVATFVALYLPMGMIDGMRYMLDIQSAHNHYGQTVQVAGLITVFPPWWANIWYTIGGIGWVALGGVGIAALFSRKPETTSRHSVSTLFNHFA